MTDLGERKRRVRRGQDGTDTSTGSTARWGRRHWSIGAVVFALVVVGAGYQYLSSDPAPKVFGTCAVVARASATHVTDCHGQDLSGLDLRGVDLRMAKLQGVDLRDADLRGAILFGADLRDADLRGTDFSEADLTSSDITGAKLGDTQFRKTGIAGMNVNETLLSADNRSVWSDTNEPRLITLSSEEQPGIVTNDCADREGLYYPGAVAVNCTLTTAATYDGTLQYQRIVEVKQNPIVSVPSEITLTVGEGVRQALRADSPYPPVQVNLHGDLPRGVRWDAESQHLLGVPRAGSEGTYAVEFAADNGHHVERDIRIVVRPAS